MKNIILLIIFNVYLFASSFSISEPLYLKEIDVNSTLNEIKNQNFEKSKTDNFGFGQFSVWKKFKVKNEIDKNKLLYAINYRTVLDFVDIYIIHSDKTVDKFLIGDRRIQNDEFIKSRFLLFPIDLKPKEEVEIYINHQNIKGIIETRWEIKDQKNLSEMIYYDSLYFGIFFGVSILLIIQSLILYLALKEKFILYYGLMAISIMIGQLVFNGFLYSFNTGLPLEWLNKPEIPFYFIILFIILFHYDFFKIESQSNYTRWFIKSLLLFPISFIIIDISIPEEEAFKLILSSIFIHWLISIYLITIGIKMSLKGVAGGWFYVLGQTLSFLTSFVVFSYLVITKDAAPPWIFYLTLIGSFINVTCLSLAFFIRIKKQQEEIKRKSEVLFELSKFHNAQMAVNNIIHQWKVPLSRIVAILTDIQAQVYFEKPIEKVIEKELPEINKNAILLVEIVQEFYRFNQKNEKSSFLFKEEIDEILKMLDKKIQESNAKIIFDCDNKNELLNTNRFAISNITTIIINNFLDIAIKRRIEHPKLIITLSKKLSKHTIKFEDNCGGVNYLVFDKVFEPFKSLSNSKSKGLGLYIAKTLVEEKLDGNIKGYNLKQGATFEINF